MAESQVAVFIDFENVAIAAEEVYGKCNLSVIMSAAERWGRCTIRRAYCDWTGFVQYQQDLIEHSVELTQLFRYSSRHRKNAADIQMVVDALETAFTHPEINSFVLVTGDSDFSAVARKLRAYGKLVIGIGLRRSTSEVLVKACDQFLIYDTLVEPDTRTAAHRLERARLLLLGALRTLLPQVEGNAVNGGQLKIMMLKMDSTFDESDLGYRQFRDFVEAQSDLIKVKVQDQVLLVTPKPSAKLEPSRGEMLEYRLVFSAAGLRLMDPYARTGILQDLFTLLSESPHIYTLDAAVAQLKAKYDDENVLRSREEVQDVVKLVKYADVFVSRPESWQLDPLSLKAGLSAQDFVDRCEGTYIVILIQKNMNIKPDLLALLIFGTQDQKTRVARLVELATDMCASKFGIERKERQDKEGWQCHFAGVPELQSMIKDLETAVLDEVPSLARAAELNDMGLRIRTTDFERARVYFLKAARMICDLIVAHVPGASLLDLEWYLASYSAASAGSYFFRFDYDLARMYYLAFFNLAKETEPVWEKVQRLIEPLTSFYFTIAANINNELLEFPPGRTHPARISIALYTHTNTAVRKAWLLLVRAMHAANPAVLRIVIQRLELFELTSQIPGTRETRAVLSRIVKGDAD